MDKIRLKVVDGGRDKQVTVNGVSLLVVPDSRSPLPVDVRVFEEDTHLVLTVDHVMHSPEEHPIRLMTEIWETRPRKPGSIATRGTSWYAVVHDLDADPSIRLEWISQAYLAALMLAEKKRITRLALPLLGSVHGNFSSDISLDLLLHSLNSLSLFNLEKICVMVPHSACGRTRIQLQSLVT